MSIKILHPQISAKIAAGEVVEKPASVVKELIENSLDAHASEIKVHVRAGGTEQIRVVDNGSGIPSGEVELAFKRFATSKISGVDDLENISTLGFRGEALPSIAAVSDTMLITRTAEDQSGTLVEFCGGRLAGTRNTSSQPGTIVTVDHLFYDLPARRKFLSSAATESSRIHSVVTHCALARPGVKFSLSIDGKQVLSTSGHNNLREVISEVYGFETADKMLEVHKDTNSVISVTGMIGPASINRSNRRWINLFVNGRWVLDRRLNYAIENAYHGFLMERRFPVAILDVTAPYEQVDVNAHPTKTEVRFKNEGQIFGSIQQAVRNTLIAYSPVPHIGDTSRPISRALLRSKHADTSRGAIPPESRSPSHLFSQNTVSKNSQPASEPLLPTNALPALRILGQIHATYIVAEGPDGLYLLDQHAAHERVLFERTVAQSVSLSPKVQSLMEPATIDLDYRQAEIAQLQSELITSMGFDFRLFGDNTYILRGVPPILSHNQPTKTFTEVLDLMADGGGFDTWIERAAYSIACHGAIRAGKILSQEEMLELTRALESCDQPHTCPHGRPTMIHMTQSLLEQEFGRR